MSCIKKQIEYPLFQSCTNLVNSVLLDFTLYYVIVQHASHDTTRYFIVTL